MTQNCNKPTNTKNGR